MGLFNLWNAAYNRAVNLRNGIAMVDDDSTGVGARFYYRMTCVMHYCDNRINLNYGAIQAVRGANRGLMVHRRG